MDIECNSRKVLLDKQNESDFLLVFDIKTEGYKVLSDAISFDLRGNYGMVLSALNKVINKQDELETYSWRGNLFMITINYKETKIVNIYNKESKLLIPTVDFKDVLKKWKEDYLREMRFFKFEKSKTLSHIYSILLLAYYMRGNIHAEETYVDSIKCSIEKCADRYGILKSTLYNQCTRELELRSIHEFYKLSDEYLKNRESGIISTLERIFNVDNMIGEFLTLFE